MVDTQQNWLGKKKEAKTFNTDLVTFPGDMTSQFQVLNNTVNKCFRDYFSKQCFQINNTHPLDPLGE